MTIPHLLAIRETERTMKRFTFLGGFILLSTAIALPFYLMRKKADQGENEENIRYDINEYIAAEGL